MNNEEMASISGSITSEDKTVMLLYILLRDHVTPGRLEQIVQDLPDKKADFTNGWLAQYAKNLAERLK